MLKKDMLERNEVIWQKEMIDGNLNPCKRRKSTGNGNEMVNL